MSFIEEANYSFVDKNSSIGAYTPSLTTEFRNLIRMLGSNTKNLISTQISLLEMLKTSPQLK